MSEPPNTLREKAGLNFDARHTSFGYQVQAVEAVKNLPFGALFHEQGLGKTKIGIDLALEWFREKTIDCVLIVTKRGLIENWKEEVTAHAHLRARVIDQNHASNFYAFNSDARILLAHYEVMKTEEARIKLFLKTRRVAAILDEAHKIKNPDAEVSKALHRLAPGFVKRVIMTGTPVANRPYDIWSQIYFLDQGASLGEDFESFKKKLDLTNDLWADADKRQAFEQELSGVFNRIRDFTVRETKATAGIELPEKLIKNVPVKLASKQQELYDQLRNELGVSVVREGKLITDDAEEILKRLLRLVQVASNPALVDESYTETPGKFVALEPIVAKAVKEDSKVIVWSSFINGVEWLQKRLAIYGAVPVHGGLPMETRLANIQAFKTNPACRVMVATPGAAKEGLTLTMANHAVFYDRSFSLDDYLQAQDRIHRISQTQVCYVWNLIAEDTVDEWVDSLLAAKRLAAQLAQNDVDKSQYTEAANYDFGQIVRAVLGLED